MKYKLIVLAGILFLLRFSLTTKGVYMYMEMCLRIENGVTLKNIQQQFNEVFPFLKLEFFNRQNGKKNWISKPEMLNGYEKPIQYASIYGKNENINIHADTTVAELESEFFRKTGLCIQVFRKSGNVWIETTLTDDWTLEQQNLEGESISNH